MNRFNYALGAAVAITGFTAATPKAEAQVNINIGAEPACPYGYYDFAPYPCAPDGYYSPEWFVGGVFVGAGPWVHGPNHFPGPEDNLFNVHHGYRGTVPNRGQSTAPLKHVDQMEHFRRNGKGDGRGHDGSGKRQ